jgi:hypothetical protein
MLPDSIPVNIYNKHISLDKLFDIINTIFYEFNNSRHPEVQTNINDRINELEEYINLLSMILSRYNYFLQKYYFADLSNEELLELGMFCNFFIVEREILRPINLHEFKVLIKNSGTEDFIKEFYNKCTLALNDIPLIEYLNEMIDFIPDYLIDLIINLLPEIDRKQVKEKVR